MADTTRGKFSQAMRAFTARDAAELYNVDNWGSGLFSVSEHGTVLVHAHDNGAPAIDVYHLVQELRRRGLELPILLRFSDVLRARVESLHQCFERAIAEYGYGNRYINVFPIKVNPTCQLVEEMVRCGRPYGFGLEAGSKPELLAVLAVADADGGPILCNGYKDAEYVAMALWATKAGRNVIPVVEKFTELELIVSEAERLGVTPNVGLRIKLAARGAGKWEQSGGDRSSFGLTVTEVARAVEFLRSRGLLDSLRLVHWHLGSQITNIRSIKAALTEGCRYYAELVAAGAPVEYVDVGGGMAVDYDGSRTNFPSSANYTMQEYANDVVAAVLEACDRAEVPHPTIVTECGRGVVAHHSVLVFNVLGSSEFGTVEVPRTLPDDTPDLIADLHEALGKVTIKNVQELYHDAIHARDDIVHLFNHGSLTLAQRSLAETILWALCRRILSVVREMDYVPEELLGLERILADTYFCNFSAFQSVPDAWAVQQLFPVMPIHRLNEEPVRRGILADITCDSDGKIDRFIDLRDVKGALELHPLNGEDYILGVFLTGAYQEILGDLHNLFGDTNSVMVGTDEDGNYRIKHVTKGDTVSDVLGYVQYNPEDLLHRFRQGLEQSLRAGRITFEESAEFLQAFENGLAGYTYLKPPRAVPRFMEVSPTGETPSMPGTNGPVSTQDARPLETLPESV